MLAVVGCAINEKGNYGNESERDEAVYVLRMLIEENMNPSGNDDAAVWEPPAVVRKR